jgi:hypothetical protein
MRMAAFPEQLNRVRKSGLPGFAKNSAKTNESKQAFVGQPRNACLEYQRITGSYRIAAAEAMAHRDFARPPLVAARNRRSSKGLKKHPENENL